MSRGWGVYTPQTAQNIKRLHLMYVTQTRIPFSPYPFCFLLSPPGLPDSCQTPSLYTDYPPTDFLITTLLHLTPPSFNIGKPTKWQQELNKMTAGTDYRKGIERCFQRTMESILDFDRVYTDRVLEFLDFLAWCMRVPTFQGT